MSLHPQEWIFEANGVCRNSCRYGTKEVDANSGVCGNAPGEPREPAELGSNAPRDGLYIKEELDLRCNMLMTGFVKSNLKKSHAVVVEKIIARAGQMAPPEKREDTHPGQSSVAL